jgi:hypothetical protein
MKNNFGRLNRNNAIIGGRLFFLYKKPKNFKHAHVIAALEPESSGILRYLLAAVGPMRMIQADIPDLGY